MEAAAEATEATAEAAEAAAEATAEAAAEAAAAAGRGRPASEGLGSGGPAGTREVSPRSSRSSSRPG